MPARRLFDKRLVKQCTALLSQVQHAHALIEVRDTVKRGHHGKFLPLQVPRCSLSTLAFLLSELVQYTTAQCASHDEMVSRLMNAGFEVGRRCIQLVAYRYATTRTRHCAGQGSAPNAEYFVTPGPRSHEGLVGT